MNQKSLNNYYRIYSQQYEYTKARAAQLGKEPLDPKFTKAEFEGMLEYYKQQAEDRKRVYKEMGELEAADSVDTSYTRVAREIADRDVQGISNLQASAKFAAFKALAEEFDLKSEFSYEDIKFGFLTEEDEKAYWKKYDEQYHKWRATHPEWSAEKVSYELSRHYFGIGSP